MYKKHRYCNYCGCQYQQENSPYTCIQCTNVTYENPIPVAVVLVPVDTGGVLLIKRGIEPGFGKWAFPGGFMELNESWQQAGARELKEETGLAVSPDKITLVCAESVPDKGILLLFMKTETVREDILGSLPLSDEVTEIRVTSAPEPLAFEMHTKILREFLQRKMS